MASQPATGRDRLIVSERQRVAALKAWRTRRANAVSERQRQAALKAWATRRSVVYKAQKVSKRSQLELKELAAEQGYYCVFLDSRKGNPRTGIVDAVLVKVYHADPDQLEFRLVQLKGGGSGLKARERSRLRASSSKASMLVAFAFWDHEAGKLEVDLQPESSRGE